MAHIAPVSVFVMPVGMIARMVGVLRVWAVLVSVVGVVVVVASSTVSGNTQGCHKNIIVVIKCKRPGRLGRKRS